MQKKGVDVWGIDLRWAFIPDDETDFSYMKDWDTQFHLNDIKVATKFSRLIRGLTGSGFNKTFLLGLSRGGQYVYAYANEETQIRKRYRDIKGLIPIEMPIKGDPSEPELIEASFARYNVFKSIYDSGMYSSTDGAGMKYLGMLAQYTPDEESPLMPGLTNKQALILSASVTYITYEPPMQPYTPFFHYLAGTFDENQMPTGFQFIDYDYILSFTSIVTSFQSLGELIDGEALYCGAENLPYDDYYSQIELPLLYIGAAGGEGASGAYTTTLLTKSDVTTLMIQLYPDEYAAVDYGHVDVILANNAEELVWQPIYNWINNN